MYGLWNWYIDGARHIHYRYLKISLTIGDDESWEGALYFGWNGDEWNCIRDKQEHNYSSVGVDEDQPCEGQGKVKNGVYNRIVCLLKQFRKVFCNEKGNLLASSYLLNAINYNCFQHFQCVCMVNLWS